MSSSVGDRGVDFAAAFCSADEDVEAAFPAFGAQWSKSHAHGRSGRAFRVRNRDQNDIALVTLHVFQVLDEEWLVRMRMEELFRLRVQPP